MKYLLPLLMLFAAQIAGAAEWDSAKWDTPEPIRWVQRDLTARVVGTEAQASPSGAEVLVLDSFTGATTYTTTGSSPRTFMGMPYNLGSGGGSNPTITKVVVYVAYTGTTAQTFNSIRVRLQLWDGWVSSNTPVFSTGLGGAAIEADVAGPVTLNPNTYAPIAVTLASPVTFTGLTSHGIGINFQGDTGSGLASSDTLTSLLRYGTSPIAVGANALPAAYGYRNASGRTDFNFVPADARSFAQTNEGTAVQLYADGVTLTPQSITNFIATPANPVVTDGSFTVSATGGASGNPVVFTIDAASAAVCASGGTNGATITILTAGTCTVLANQAGNATYSAAPQQSLAVTIGSGLLPQSITNFIATPASPVVSDGSFTASASGGASGNPVVFSIDAASAAVCTAGGTNGATVTILTAGTCTVLANQAGNATYSAAPQQSLAVTVGASAGALVQDGGFEAGIVPTYWAQTSTNFGTPLCDASCGGVGPRTGSFWAWFGGAGTSAEAGSLQQVGVISTGPKVLNFYLWWSSSVATPPDPAAVFNVKIDGTTIFTLTPATASAYSTAYTLATVDISAYADGNSHTLRFESNNAAASGSTNMHLDDISIVSGVVDRIFANGFQ